MVELEISSDTVISLAIFSGRNLEFTDQKKRDDWIKSELKTYGGNLSEKEEQLKNVVKEVSSFLYKLHSSAPRLVENIYLIM